MSVESITRQLSGEAVETLRSIMRTTRYPASARVAAANSILDRAWGKPKQAIEAQAEIRVTIRKLLEPEGPMLDVSPNVINGLEGIGLGPEPAGSSVPQGPGLGSLIPLEGPEDPGADGP